MLISLQSDLKKRIRLSLIVDLANNSIGSSECRDSTKQYTEGKKEINVIAVDPWSTDMVPCNTH